MSLNKRLREYWKKKDIVPYDGVGAAEIDIFEAQSGVSIPADFRSFLLEFNGTLDMTDSDYFRFLRLQEFASSDKAPEMNFGEAFTAKYPKVPNGFYVFADYLQWCYGYAIQLGRGAELNEVVLIGGITAPVVASSFTDFMELYMVNSMDIHPERGN